MRLVGFAERRFSEYEDLNRTGKTILWAIRKEETLADLETFLRRDETLRSELCAIPHDVEMPFGMGHRFDNSREAALVELGDGRTLSLRGLIDRVDTQVKSGAPVVVDYKTSRSTSQKEFDRDPVLGGEKLQLGAYAYAAKQALGADEAHAYYWYASSRGNFKKAGYRWGSEQDDRFVSAITTVVDGIEAGQFPPNPGDFNFHYGTFQNCAYCDFKRLCPADRNKELENAIASGRLADYVAMKEPDLHEGEE